MDSYSVSFKANTHLSSDLKNGFHGEKVRGSFNENGWVNRLAKSFKSDNKALKLSPNVAYAVATPNLSKQAASIQAPPFFKAKVNPKNVASIILGGGAGTQLFPLTRRSATPAVPVGGCYRLIDIPMSNCINSGINKIFVLTQFNSASLNRHISRTYFGNGVSFGEGFVEVLAATQTPGKSGMYWFQGTADAVRQFTWVFEDAKNRNVENILILAGDHMYRMDYMDFVQNHIDRNADISISCAAVGDRSRTNGDVFFAYKPMIIANSQQSSPRTKNTIEPKTYGALEQPPFNRGSTPSLEPSNKSTPFPSRLTTTFRASDYGLVKMDSRGRIIQFAEKPKGANLNAMRVDTTSLGLSREESLTSPYIASMGVYVFKTDILLNLLKGRYPTSNDFGSEIIPAAVKEHNVQAYIFRDYWEDIGTIKTFYDANLALTEEFPKFEFYDPKTPFYTSPRFLPPTKIDKCQIVDAIISHGCFLRECNVQHSIVGERSRLDYGVELKDTIMMGADNYQTEPEIAALLAEGKVPIGIGRNTKIKNCIIDKNAKIGKDVIIMNKEGVQEADRPEQGFYIRSGITIILEKATIGDGTVI